MTDHRGPRPIRGLSRSKVQAAGLTPTKLCGNDSPSAADPPVLSPRSAPTRASLRSQRQLRQWARPEGPGRRELHLPSTYTTPGTKRSLLAESRLRPWREKGQDLSPSQKPEDTLPGQATPSELRPSVGDGGCSPPRTDYPSRPGTEQALWAGPTAQQGQGGRLGVFTAPMTPAPQSVPPPTSEERPARAPLAANSVREQQTHQGRRSQETGSGQGNVLTPAQASGATK